jgi:Flp pilus assembly pilin Flp
VKKDKLMRAHKGQSTVEYILLVTAVIVVIVLFTAGNASLFQQRLGSVFTTSTQDMLNVASRLSDNAAVAP